jgi:hypothetical protein
MRADSGSNPAPPASRRVPTFAARDDQLCQQDLDDLAPLVARFAAHVHHPPVGAGAGRNDLLDLAHHLEDIARPRRLRPVDLAAGADDPAAER